MRQRVAEVTEFIVDEVKAFLVLFVTSSVVNALTRLLAQYRRAGPPIMSGIHGQWNEWSRERRLRVLPKLVEVIETFEKRRTRGGEVNAAILKHGYKFENGGFVPVNALGDIPS